MTADVTPTRRRTRWPLVIGLVAALAVVGVGLGWWWGTRGDDPAASKQVLPAPPDGPLTVQRPVKLVPDTSGIPGAVMYDQGQYMTLATQDGKNIHYSHVTGPVRYAMTPPAGGPHDIVWMNAGVYTKPVPSERAVHNMEHGAIWITYRPSLSKAQVQKLTAFVGKQSMIAEPQGKGGVAVSGQANRFMDLSPWASDALPAPIVLSSWGHQLRIERADDPRMQRFVDVFRHRKPWSPEVSEPVDGVPTGTGGVADRYGAARPNQPGTKKG